jgi:hypothetical protein
MKKKYTSKPNRKNPFRHLKKLYLKKSLLHIWSVTGISIEQYIQF